MTGKNVQSEAASAGNGKFTLLLFSGAFLIRLVVVLCMRDINAPSARATTGADGVEYNLLGLQTARGNGYCWADGQPTSFRAPGFPFVLAAVYAIFGECYPAAWIAFCLLGAATCVGAYFLAREVLPDRTARLAGLLTCLYVPHIYFATRFDSENVFIPCFVWGLWGIIRHFRTGAPASAVAVGLLLGYGALTRPFALLLPPLLGLVWLGQRADSRRRLLRSYLLFLAGFAAAIAPWTVRNYRVHHEFVLIATHGGSTFYGSNNDVVLNEREHLGGWIATVALPGRDVIDAAPNEVEHDRIEWRLGLAWVRDNIESLPRLEMYKFVRFWLPDLDSKNKPYVLTQLLCYTPLLPFIILGMITAPWSRSAAGWWVVHLALLATVLTALIFWGSPRFRDGNAPILMIYAAAGMQRVGGWFKRPKQPGTL